MPRIELIPVPFFGPQDPYHWEVDNLPLKSIVRRQQLINLALDDVIEQIRDAVGTQNTIANRLNQSIDADGNLKKTAIDEALHSIEEHEDTDNYVRMQKAESDKLALVADEATDVYLTVETEDGDIPLDAGVIRFEPSNTITLSVTSPNIVKFNLGFPVEAAHQHFYNLTPVAETSEDPDYLNYKVNSSATAYIEGSLRVYINGVRINPVSEDAEESEINQAAIYVPGALVDDPWTLLHFVPDHENGTFRLSSAISEDDVIKIDFDVSFV